MVKGQDVKVLLLGGTGIIGGELLKGLINDTNAIIWVLLRSEKNISTLIYEKLAKRLAYSKDFFGRIINSRLFIVVGDLEKNNIGLNLNEDLPQFDIIINSAGETTFNSENRCKLVNISGTQNLANFINSKNNKALLIHLSTAAVSVFEENCKLPAKISKSIKNNSYVKSKKAGEEIINRELKNSIILRPSIVINSSNSADENSAKDILWFAGILSKFNKAPININAKLDMISTDYLVRVILTIINTKPSTRGTYFVSSGDENCVSFKELYDVACKHYPDLYKLKFVNSDEGFSPINAFAISANFYLPFINADTTYPTTDTSNLLGKFFPENISVLRFIDSLLSKITKDNSLKESLRP